jgi:uncharacterized SAM-binding protein YcdF (DUF218 family)
MKAGKFKKILPYVVVFIILFAIVVRIKINYIDGFGNPYRLYKSLSDSLTMKLAMEKPIPAGFSNQKSQTTTLIYVLGGNQKNLVQRFDKASGLYHQGVAGKIHLLSRPGITEFSPELGRNLTNDEWAVRELEILQVKRGDIIPVSVEPSYFGTLSEANRISDMVRKKGCKRLVLVSSKRHTRRSYDTFNSFLSKTPVEIYVYGAGDSAGLKELLSEYIKLLFYENVVLPLNRWSA